MLCRNVGSNQIAELLISRGKCNKHEAQRAPTKMYVLYTLYACSFDLANTSMADYEVRISNAISKVMPPKPSDTASCDQIKSWQ